MPITSLTLPWLSTEDRKKNHFHFNPNSLTYFFNLSEAMFRAHIFSPPFPWLEFL